jgi:DNA invertase Pin-like site-specific DNA recombinase
LSVREGWLDTSGPVRPLLVAIFGWVAEQERTRLIERVHAGLERARRQGKALGRPRTSIVLLRAAAELVEGGTTVAAAARAKGVRASLYRYLSETLPPWPPETALLSRSRPVPSSVSANTRF